MKISNKIYRFAMLTLLLWSVFVGCKKDEIPTAPVVVTPPTAITPDPRPVEGDYQFFFTDPVRLIL